VPLYCVFDRDIRDLIVWIHVRKAIKVAVQGLSLLVALPFAAMAGFGRFSHGFHALAQFFALVPGLIGVIMQIITIFLTALSIVGERERGTLDQLLVTPIGSTGLMLGKIVPYAVIGIVDFLGVFAAMQFVFKVQIAGSVPLLLVLAVGFLLAALGLGLLVSSVAQSQLQAMLMTMGIMLPSILLSGFFFERDAMPWIMQVVGYAIPLTYFLEILRGIILRGAGMAQLWPSVTAMLALGLFLIIVASVRFARSTT